MILRNGLGIGLTSEVELARYTFLILRMERSTHRSEHWRGVWEALADGNLEPAERLEAAYRAWRIVQRASNKS